MGSALLGASTAWLTSASDIVQAIEGKPCSCASFSKQSGLLWFRHAVTRRTAAPSIYSSKCSAGFTREVRDDDGGEMWRRKWETTRMSPRRVHGGRRDICVVCDVRKRTNLVKIKGDLGGKVMTMQKALPCSFASSCFLLLAAAAPTALLALLLLLLIAWNHLLLQPTPPLSILPRTAVATAASATRSFFDALLNNNVCVPGQHLTPHTPHTSHLTPHT